MSFIKSCPGSKAIREPSPKEVRCTCGEKAEIWSDEVSITCKKCKKEITQKMAQTCLDWCAMAKECIGTQKYNKYLKSKKTNKRRK